MLSSQGQVLEGGGEPALLRKALAQALPNAPGPAGQMVKEPAMLHTTIARLLQPSDATTVDAGEVTLAVDMLSQELCGLTAVFKELWFVEELEVLALALNGHFIKHRAPLKCPVAEAAAAA